MIANAAIVPAGANGSSDVFASNPTDLVVDINGYFAPPAAGGLSFLQPAPVPGAGLADLSGQGPPPFSGQLDVNVLASGCGGTPGAQAYVFNSTVVPSGALRFLTLWPQGAARPTVATLNALDGTITDNMAIVPDEQSLPSPLANTQVCSFATNATRLIWISMFRPVMAHYRDPPAKSLVPGN